MNTVIEHIKSDLFRYEGKVNIFTFIRHYFLNRSFKYCFWLRSCKSQNYIVAIIARIMHRMLSSKYGIQIERQTNIGYGLYIGHHMSIVVNSTAIIGNNCNLGPFTTIGSNHGQSATIGDNVYIGPSVNVVENVTIGSNSTIGAGAVVVNDVPENTTIAGVPAKVISHKKPSRYIKNKWHID